MCFAFHLVRRTPLMLAVVGGHVDAVSLLLEREASVNVTNKQGFTALHLGVTLTSIEAENVVPKHPNMFPLVGESFGVVHPLCPAAVWPGGVHPVSVGARSLCSTGGLPRSDGHPPGRSPRPRLLAERAAEYRLCRGVVATGTSRPWWIYTAALGLLLRSVSSNI